MPEHHTMRRFDDDEQPERQGAFTFEAKDYGIGAFSWNIDGNGVRWILFRHPNKVYTNSEGKYETIGSVPVNVPAELLKLYRGADQRGWTWDGDEDKPTISPSILFKTIHGESTEWQETFHGWIKAGILEVL